MPVSQRGDTPAHAGTSRMPVMALTPALPLTAAGRLAAVQWVAG